MRIAVVNWSRRREGGTERYLSNIIPALTRAGHSLALWTEVDLPIARQPIVPEDQIPTTVASALGADRAVATLRDWAPDVLFCHGLLTPALESRVLDVAPAIFFVHSYYGTCVSGTKRFAAPVPRPCHRRFGLGCFVQYYPRRCGGLNPVTMVSRYLVQRDRLALLSRYAAIVTTSQHMRDEYLHHGFPERTVRLVSYVVTTGTPTLAGRRRPDAPWHLVFMGRMDRTKGGTILFEALPEVRQRLRRPVRVTFAGDGPARRTWEDFAARLDSAGGSLTASFVGWLDDARLGALLDEADLLVMPSIWPEPFGLAGPEAGLRGVPAAAFAVGGIPEWLQDGVNGCLAPGDPPRAAGLADAIVRCLESPDTHRRLREGAVRAAQRFSMTRHLAELELVFAAAGGRATPRAV